ncbi:MAG: haloalkane dehalogenase [Chloroflexi bacterium]|nr:haloalkane dehalogenase [Chloroflexota bacterium]
MPLLRTPDERFANLPDYHFAPHYVEINGARVHYVDEGQGEVILCLHGEPSWVYLYRKMITPLAQQFRVVALDFIGFGRSDKYSEIEAYSAQMHYDTVLAFIEALDLRGITLVCQDWGGLIGLPVAADHSERFARLVIMNTWLPVGEPLGEAFMAWRSFAEKAGRELPIGFLFSRSMAQRDRMPKAIQAAYEAPFPDASYKAGAAAFPLLVPMHPDDAAVPMMRRAREKLQHWHKPALVMFSDGDPVTRGADVLFRRLIPGAQGQPEITIADAGHFLQEEKGEEIAQQIAAFMARTPLG